MKKVLLALVFVILAMGCIQQPYTPVKEIQIKGHPIYQFNSDVRESLRFASDNETQIRDLILNSTKMSIIFNASSAEDNTYFNVALYNLVTKIQTYFVYEGKVGSFGTYYLLNGTWYQDAKPLDGIPVITGTRIIIEGPNTGATENAVRLRDNRTVIIKGMTYGNLSMGADKLSLIVLNVTKV